MRNKDEISRNLLKNMEHFLLFAQKEEYSNLLELSKNNESAKNYQYLKRLKRSLSHYLERKRELFYVGFLGNFSAGKSSTINSILSLKGKEARDTDLNPTDKAITLITHSKNNSLLIAMNREGDVPVRTQFVEKDILEKIVLIDTPGSGDPLISEEIIRESLPLCDLIFYVFSSANPFDRSDIPLLKLQQEHLFEVPIKFIITRADEFRLNKYEDISSANLDEVKYNNTISTTLGRIHHVVDTDKFRVNDFILTIVLGIILTTLLL